MIRANDAEPPVASGISTGAPPTERTWLDRFIEGWLARRPLLAQAAE